MLSLSDVERIAQDSAATTLKRAGLRVSAEPIADEYGKDAYEVTVVLPGDGAPLPTGLQAIEFLSLTRQTLSASGDDGFPYVSYVTEAELASEAFEANGRA